MSGIREDRISRSILNAIYYNTPEQRSVLSRLKALFSVIQLVLTRWRNDYFLKLRKDVWGFGEEQYRESFKQEIKGKKKAKLIPAGDLGYSGSVRTYLRGRG